MPRGAAKERREQAREWIRKVGLDVDRDATKYPHQLSGGMRQRVAIARSLILKPKIILMDEPFGALDPRTRLNMQDMLVSLTREAQATVFFVTHSIEEAVYLGDRTFIISSAPGNDPEGDAGAAAGFSGARDAAAAASSWKSYSRFATSWKRSRARLARATSSACRRLHRRALVAAPSVGAYLKARVSLSLELAVRRRRRRAGGAVADRPDALLPIIGGLEIAYLTGLIADAAIPHGDRRSRGGEGA